MTINLQLPMTSDILKPTITVIGVGGAGGNAVNNMIASNLEGVNFVVANTDAQALDSSLATRTVQLGASITRGLGAGANPDMGRAAAEEAADEIAGHVDGSNMLFITAGMGGGTGTGAAPVVARIAREQGILTVAVVTKPFQFEGAHRMRLAESGLKELQEYVDTLIIIPNQNLFRIANERTTFADAFKLADEVLHSGVRGVTDLMVKPGLINLDFADIRTVMREMGKAMMGTGEAAGDRRAIDAAEAAISNPLLDDVSLKGAKAALINITGGPDMTLFEVDEAANRIREEVDPDSNIIFGSAFNDSMEGRVRVSVVATGIDQIVGAQRPLATAADPKKPYLFTPARAEGRPAPRPVHEGLRPPVSAGITTAPVASPVAAEPERGTVTAFRASADPRPVTAASPVMATAGSSALALAEPPARPAEEGKPSLFARPEEATPAEIARSVETAPVSLSPRRESREPGMEEASTRSLFQRIAEVSRSLTPKSEASTRADLQERQLQVTEKPRAETAKKSAASEEDQFLDIPAFLRRQAN